MPLLSPTNCTFDLYRGFDPSAPYVPPNGAAVFCGLKGIVKQHVRNGRFGWFGGQGANAPLHWTTVLLVPISDDLRDAYDTQLNFDTISDGDTVMMADYPIVGTCTAFVIVAVQRVDRGGPGDYLRVYLDRARPCYGNGCPKCGNIPIGCCSCGPGAAWPKTLYATLTVTAGTCICLPGTIPLVWNGQYGVDATWVADTASCGIFPAILSFSCDGANAVQFGGECNYEGSGVLMFDATTDTYTCPPTLYAEFNGIVTTTNPCCSSVTLNAVVTQ